MSDIAIGKSTKTQPIITKEILIDMYVNKQMTDEQIAKELGCAQPTINKYRKKYGIETTYLDQILTKEILIEMYVNKQMSDEQIAKEFGCSETTISQCRKKYGIDTACLDQILTKEILIDMYVNKQMTDEQIAKELGCAQPTINKYRKKYGISTVDRNLELHQKITKEILIDMYVNKQMTDTQIAKELGCSSKIIGKYRKKYGINTIDRKLKLHQKLTKEVLIDMYINKQMTDEQIAKELGCGAATIGRYRKKYGIDTIDSSLDQIVTKEILIDMYVNKQMFDEQIAEEFGCYKSTISKYRKKYGIESTYLDQILTKEILMDMYVNKQMSDMQIAEEFGCSDATVGQYRKKYGIDTACLDQILTKEILMDMYVNKQMTDEQIAKELECSVSTIGRYRKKYGIDTACLDQILTKEILMDMYVNKQMSDEQIAKELGCSVSTIGRCRKKYGIDTIDNSLDQILTKEILIEMYVNKQMSDRQIAKELGCGEATIRRYRKKYGIETNTQLISTQQQEVYDEIYDLFINANKTVPEILINDRKAISPFEIDIYLPEYNFGIEFNGGFWHSEVIHDKMYHYNKSTIAEENGIFIYHIFSYEWVNDYKRQKILNQIKNLIGLNATKTYARKCEIREVAPKEKSSFLNANHVQGNDRSSLNLGLYYNDELVTIMTFVKPRSNTKYMWKLSRFCSKANYNVIDGASKLFKYFIDNYLNNNETVIAYSDIAKSKGNLYGNLGFEFSHISDPNYVWLKRDNDCKTHYQCQMKNEIEIMQKKKYHRIYDCGNKVWTYTKIL